MRVGRFARQAWLRRLEKWDFSLPHPTQPAGWWKQPQPIDIV